MVYVNYFLLFLNIYQLLLQSEFSCYHLPFLLILCREKAKKQKNKKAKTKTKQKLKKPTTTTSVHQIWLSYLFPLNLGHLNFKLCSVQLTHFVIFLCQRPGIESLAILNLLCWLHWNDFLVFLTWTEL